MRTRSSFDRLLQVLHSMNVSLPCYNVKQKQFQCFCKGSSMWFKKRMDYQKHQQSQRHQGWKEQFSVQDDEIPIPLCSICLDPFSDFASHQKKCWATVPVSIFEEALPEMRRGLVPCDGCGMTISFGTLSSARKWKEHIYCKTCFKTTCLSDEVHGNILVKTCLIHEENGKCPLCKKNILTTDTMIYEHMNPFLKTSNPTESLRTNVDPRLVLQQCRDQGVKMVHEVCAQIKTKLETATHQIQSKKILQKQKRKVAENDVYETSKKLKSEFYASHILPHISSSLHKLNVKFKHTRPNQDI